MIEKTNYTPDTIRMPRPEFYATATTPITLIVGVDAPYNTTKDINSYFQEFRNLVKSNRIAYNHELYLRLRELDAAYFFTRGKLQEIKKLCDENNVEEVIISEPLTAQQERNIGDMLRCKVYDRTQLILEIFEKGAHSAEGKAQVAIAMFQHRKTRLTGKGVHMSQQAGRVGERSGPGETAKEKETRHIESSILQLRKQLDRLQQTRDTQRKRRIDNRVPHVCLIGYTNAGKSTILNALTKSKVLAEDKLFATLDTTTRELYINSKKMGLISDTVGFIQQLPHDLVEAFKSTLSELQYADLLIQVVDISDANWESHIEVVQSILRDLNIQKNMLYVFNKADDLQFTPYQLHVCKKYSPHVFTSALSKEGLIALTDYLESWQQRHVAQ